MGLFGGSLGFAGCCAKGRARGHRPYRHKKTDYSITTFRASEQKGRRSNEGKGDNKYWGLVAERGSSEFVKASAK